MDIRTADIVQVKAPAGWRKRTPDYHSGALCQICMIQKGSYGWSGSRLSWVRIEHSDGSSEPAKLMCRDCGLIVRRKVVDPENATAVEPLPFVAPEHHKRVRELAAAVLRHGTFSSGGEAVDALGLSEVDMSTKVITYSHLGGLKVSAKVVGIRSGWPLDDLSCKLIIISDHFEKTKNGAPEWLACKVEELGKILAAGHETGAIQQMAKE